MHEKVINNKTKTASLILLLKLFESIKLSFCISNIALLRACLKAYLLVSCYLISLMVICMQNVSNDILNSMQQQHMKYSPSFYFLKGKFCTSRNEEQLRLMMILSLVIFQLPQINDTQWGVHCTRLILPSDSSVSDMSKALVI